MSARCILTLSVLLGSILPFLPLVTAQGAAGATKGSSPAAGDGGNEFCPVRPTEPGLEDYELEHGGKKVRFCCEPCMQTFKKNPQEYVKNLPQFEGSAAELEEHPDATDSLLGRLSSDQARDHLLLFSSTAVGLLLTAWLIRWLMGRMSWNSSVRPGVICICGCVLLAVVVALYQRVQLLNEEIHQGQLKDLLHFATYHDFGDTPVPAKPPLPKQLKATFYRGNDERSPRLFNGGHYRTCTFQIALCDEAGREIPLHESVSGRRVGIRLEIERAPYTPDFFWTPDRMQRYFLTQRCDPFMGSEGPIADRVELRTDQEVQRWSAWFPIGIDEKALKGEQSYSGIIYVCEAFSTPEVMRGARLHYAIQYDVHVNGGHIDEQSDLWMGALYRRRKIPQWRLPLEQWFSHEPIPVLPKPSVQDPKLLGISDYTTDPQPASEH